MAGTLARLRFEQMVKDSINKQLAQRIRWFEANYSKIFGDPSLPPDEIPFNAAILYDEINMYYKKLAENGRLERRRFLMSKEKPPPNPVEISEEEAREGVMYPIEEEILKQLYTGISENGEGKLKYLKSRKAKHPDDKYKTPVTGNQVYGWKIAERQQKRDVCFGRAAVIEGNFYRRNGVMVNDSSRKKAPLPSGKVTVEFL